MAEKSRIKTESLAQRLSLEIGARVNISFKGQEKTMKALFLGMDPGSLIIIRLTGVNGWHEHLFEGNKITVKFVSSGMLYGFQSTCLGYYFKKNIILVFLTYPDSVQSMDMRKEQRVDSCLPATVIYGEENWRGYLLDISPSGCGFALTHPPERGASKFLVGRQLTISFQLSDTEGRQNLPCRVMNLRDEEQTLILGLHIDFETEGNFSLDLFKRFLEKKGGT